MRSRLVALCLLVLLAGCGGAEERPPAPARDELVGTADVERLLVSTQKRKSPRLRVGAASCPDQVRLANGATFTCTVKIEGVTAPYSVTLRDVDAAGSGGHFALEPAKPIIDVTRIVSLIRGKLQPTARAATVRCGAAGAPRSGWSRSAPPSAAPSPWATPSRRSPPRSRTSRARSSSGPDRPPCLPC